MKRMPCKQARFLSFDLADDLKMLLKLRGTENATRHRFTADCCSTGTFDVCTKIRSSAVPNTATSVNENSTTLVDDDKK